ncbi:MAG: glycosyltransferase [Terrabacter sp.]
MTVVSAPPGSIVVPAHDEESVLGRTLDGLATLVAGGTQVVVAANGCADRTVEVARGFSGVHVLDLPEPGKTGALNAADEVLTQWPRLYLDADIEISPASVQDVFGVLALADAPLAARPAVCIDTSRSSWVVRRHYAARARLATGSRSLWGAGAYALTEQGHARLGVFPDVVADDLFVDALFSADEVAVVDTDPVVVRAPRTCAGLLAIARRTALGNAELRAGSGVADTSRATARALARSVRGPVSLLDALVYAGVTVVGRRRAARPGSAWDRDDSSR